MHLSLSLSLCRRLPDRFSAGRRVRICQTHYTLTIDVIKRLRRFRSLSTYVGDHMTLVKR